MLIAGIAKNSCVDYPGELACVLFCQGCDLDCFYCHNRAIIGPLGAGMARLDNKEVMAFLNKRAGLIDAVVISGGEPTLQKDLIPFMETVKSLGYKVKLDTNGRSPQVINAVLEKGICDYFAVDYKAPLARYEEFCGKGADGSKVLQVIRLLKMAGVAFEVRTTVVPQLDLNDLRKMADELPPLPRYVLNPYRIPPQYREADKDRILKKAYTKTEIAAFAEAIKDLQSNTVST